MWGMGLSTSLGKGIKVVICSIWPWHDLLKFMMEKVCSRTYVNLNKSAFSCWETVSFSEPQNWSIVAVLYLSFKELLHWMSMSSSCVSSGAFSLSKHRGHWYKLQLSLNLAKVWEAAGELSMQVAQCAMSVWHLGGFWCCQCREMSERPVAHLSAEQHMFDLEPLHIGI